LGLQVAGWCSFGSAALGLLQVGPELITLIMHLEIVALALLILLLRVVGPLLGLSQSRVQILRPAKLLVEILRFLLVKPLKLALVTE